MRSVRSRPARPRPWPRICNPARNAGPSTSCCVPAVTAIGYSAEADGRSAGPSCMLKTRLMKQVRSENRDVRRHGGSPSSWPALVAAACFAIAVGAGLLNASLRDRVVHDESRMAQQSAMIADVTAPDAKRYRFGHGSVVVRGHNLYIAMHALAQPPEGKVYQAWTLPKGSKKMAPSVTFRPAASGETLLRLPDAANASRGSRKRRAGRRFEAAHEQTDCPNAALARPNPNDCLSRSFRRTVSLTSCNARERNPCEINPPSPLVRSLWQPSFRPPHRRN